MSKTLIASISGIRGIFGAGLDPDVLVRYAAAFGRWCRESNSGTPVVVIGQDSRVTGNLCSRIVSGTLMATGCSVIDAGLATTPTVEMAVKMEDAAGGIVFSASHNPEQWNALKLLDGSGEFLRPSEAEKVIASADALPDDIYASFDQIGSYRERDYLEQHIDAVVDLDFIDPDAIARRNFKVVVDGINSVGAIALPQLLRRLGVISDRIVMLNGEASGRFAHEAEPLPANLTDLIARVREEEADLGLAVDPDADRLALVANGGTYVSEELTQVLAADFLWKFRDGPFVTNLSSSRAIDDVAERYGAQVYRSAVGEVNVVEKMYEVNAILGGEGNGGVILPDLHYGRDSLVGTAMVLQHLANENMSMAEWHDSLPHYTIVKHKTALDGRDPGAMLDAIATQYEEEDTSLVDGVKISFAESWVHMRQSNTEPILRIYAEAPTEDEAHSLAERFKVELQEAAP